MKAQIAALEAEAAAARSEADELSRQLIGSRRELEEAADRLRDEAEARMRAESRAAAGER